jgi:hypothetical protein
MTKTTKSAHARWAAIAREPEKNFEVVSSAMAAFAGRAKARDLDELLALLQGLARGEALLSQAFQWSEPTAGRKSELAEFRGLQWRLVMAVAGLEIMIKSLIGKEKPGIDEFRILEKRLALAVAPIPAPSLARSVREKWIEDEKLFKFLSVNNYDLKILRRFLADDDCHSIDGLAEQLALAKALRNCIAHAALSATKCRQLKLRPTLALLPGVIHEVSEGIFGALFKSLDLLSSGSTHLLPD